MPVSIIGLEIRYSIVTFCYVSIFLKRRNIRQQQAQTVAAAPDATAVARLQRPQPSVKGRNLKLFLQILCLFVVFPVTWVPRGLAGPIFGRDNIEYRVTFELCYILAVLNSSVNFFVYLLFKSKFRKDFLRRGRRRCLPTTATTTDSSGRSGALELGGATFSDG